MKVSELVVMLSAKGGDQVRRELNSIDKSLDKTAKSADKTKSSFDDVNISGYNLGSAMKLIQGSISSLGPEMTVLAAAGGAVVLSFAAVAATMATATASVIAFANESRSAGVEYESMVARLEAITKSSKRTQEILALAREQALPSKFTTKQMEEASVALASYGLNVERTLPIIAKLGQALGADNARMGLYLTAFSQLKSGQMPDIQSLSAMSISRSDLKKKGIKFDGSTLLSSTEEVMVAMEKIVNEKFGNIFEKTKDTTESMAASFQDAMEKIQRSIGMVVNDALKPFIKSFGSLMSSIAESKFPEVVARDLVSPLTVWSQGIRDTDSAMKDLMATWYALSTVIPRNAAGMLKMILEMKAASKQGAGEFVKVAAKNVGKWANSGALFDVKGTFTGGENLIDTIKRYRKSMDQKPPQVPTNKTNKDLPFGGAPPDPKDKEKQKTGLKRLKEIADNTKRQADLLELRRQSIGGGALASLGVTGAEIAGMGLKQRSEIGYRGPIKGDTMVLRGIRSMIQNESTFLVNGGSAMPVR